MAACKGRADCLDEVDDVEVNVDVDEWAAALCDSILLPPVPSTSASAV